RDFARGLEQPQRRAGWLPYRPGDAARDLECDAAVIAGERQHGLDTAVEVCLALGHAECFTHTSRRDAIDPLTAMDDADTERAVVCGHIFDTLDLPRHQADRRATFFQLDTGVARAAGCFQIEAGDRIPAAYNAAILEAGLWNQHERVLARLILDQRA